MHSVLPVQSMRNKALSVKSVQNLIGIVLVCSSENDYFIVLCHLAKELNAAWPHTKPHSNSIFHLLLSRCPLELLHELLAE